MESRLAEIIERYSINRTGMRPYIYRDIQYLISKVESFEDTFAWLQTLSKREDIIKIKELEYKIQELMKAQELSSWKYKRGDKLVVTKDFVTLITDFKPMRFKEGVEITVLDPKPSEKKGEDAYFVSTQHFAVHIERETLESITEVKQEELS
jgi:hypothetical protein